MVLKYMIRKVGQRVIEYVDLHARNCVFTRSDQVYLS